MDDYKLHCGDCLNIMKDMDTESIDLIYLDPPFNSNRNYETDKGKFTDKWKYDSTENEMLLEYDGKGKHIYDFVDLTEDIHSSSMKAYLTFMANRLIEMKRMLKNTGSIYLQCDPTASHYLKIIMDKTFGHDNFRNEIVWKRHDIHNDKLYGSIHDTIFYYSYDKKEIHSEVLIPLDEGRIKNFNKCDEHGKYEKSDLKGHGKSNGISGEKWRGISPSVKADRHWSVPRTGRYAKYIEDNFIPGYRSIVGVHDRLDALDEACLIVWNNSKKPYLKRYLTSCAGTPPQSMWYDIKPITKNKKTSNYPTQKPIELLDRIIKASSNTGDTVLDPFCGSGTTLVAAQRLQRKAIGIDVSKEAIEVTTQRLKDEWAF